MPQALTKQTITGNALHRWTIQSYEQHERHNRWYWVMIPVGLALVAYGLLAQNFLFSLIIILFSIILFLQSHQSPAQVQFVITELGIVIGQKFYSFSELYAFYIIYEPPEVKTLFIETKSAFRPLLRVPLLDTNPVEVRHTLREYLDEDIEKEKEPASDAFARNWMIH